ncbi:MAG TPA: glycerophosphodiester phosphodiesterase [Steroidobacteraceae bacterium]|jgi:glycerophosphoryl diester phosphodiesterase|nr:glycerophosphodiester phosphodiesterase [Steroidobacteraceae bacterium]
MSESTDTGQTIAPRALVPVIIGHRGASGYVPEHTLLAYFLAIQQGADFIEPDLVSTRDGVLVARHENEIGGTTDVEQHLEFAERRVTKVVDGASIEGWFTEDFTLAELKTLRVRERIAQLRPANARFDGQLEIPTLDEILDLAHGADVTRAHAARACHEPSPRRIGIYPETKHPSYFARIGLALEEPLLATLGRHGYEGRDAPVFIQSFETGNLQQLRSLTDTALVQLVAAAGAPFDWVLAGDARNYAGMITRRGLAQVAQYADALGVEKTLVIPRTAHGTLGSPTALVDDAHAQGLLVHAWTFRAENHFLPAPLRRGANPLDLGDLAGELIPYLKAGLDGVFVDQPILGVHTRDALLMTREPS